MNNSSARPEPASKRLRGSIRIPVQFQLLIVFTLLFTISFAIVAGWFYSTMSKQAAAQLSDELIATAQAIAAGVDGDEHMALYNSDLPQGRPLEDPRYRRLVEWLSLAQDTHGREVLPDGSEDFRIYPYTYVAGKEPGTIVFIGSGGALEKEPRGVPFRRPSTPTTRVMLDGLTRQAAHIEPFIVDPWGIWVTGVAPIYDSAGRIAGTVAVDIRDTTVIAVRERIQSALGPIFLSTYAFLLLGIFFTAHSFGRPISALTRWAERVADGNYDIGAVGLASKSLRSEVNTLAGVLDLMVLRIRGREASLSESRSRYRALIESLPGPAILCDQTGRVTFVSAQLETLLGYSVEQWQDQDNELWRRVIHPDDYDVLAASLSADAFERRHTLQTEARFLHRDGSYRWLDVRVTIDPMVEPPLIAGILLDIQERHLHQQQLQSYADELKIAYQELQETQQQLVQSARLASVGEMATGVVHELNNPLAAIRGLAQILSQQYPDDPELQEPLAQIVNSTDRMVKITRHLRGFVRQTSIERTSVDINRLLDEALILFNVQLARHKIELAKDFGQDLPSVYGVAQQLEQVAINLFTNARDAIMEKGAPGRIVLRTWYEPADSSVYFSVLDTGVGIPPERHVDVFAPFYTTKPSGYGTGLGLSISLRVVQEHKGYILLDSEPGEWTKFTVVLPVMRSVKKE